MTTTWSGIAHYTGYDTKHALPLHAFTAYDMVMSLPQEFKARLDVISQKLHGVDNVLGHQLAVHEMAGILGVGVPQVMSDVL